MADAVPVQVGQRWYHNRDWWLKVDVLEEDPNPDYPKRFRCIQPGARRPLTIYEDTLQHNWHTDAPKDNR